MSAEKEMIPVSDNAAISACFKTAVFTQGISVGLNAFTANKIQQAAPTKVALKEPANKTTAKNVEVAPWGSNNLYPQERLKMIRKDTELSPLFKKKAAFNSGVAVIPVMISGYAVAPDGSIRPTITPADPIKYAEQYAFTNNRHFNRWWREANIDLAYFANIFPEIILGADRKKVIRIAHQEATKARLGVQKSAKSGIEICILNSDWENYKDENSSALPVIDSVRTEDVELIRAQKGKFHYIYLSSYPSPGDDYYQVPAHEGYFLSGWYDIGIAIPEVKKWLIKKKAQMSLHIEIDTDYWPSQYPKWKDMTEKERAAAVKAEMQGLEADIIGVENSGVVFTTSMVYDKLTSTQRSLWKITEVKSTGTDGEGIIDSRESSMHKYRAVGFDPAILGLGPGRENAGGGSGSDKWAAAKLFIAECYPERQVVLDPVFFAYEYNGWASEGIFPMVIDHPVFSTNTASEKLSDSPNPKRADAAKD